MKKAASGGTESLNARELSDLLKDAKKGKLTKKQKKKLIKKELQKRQNARPLRQKPSSNVPEREHHAPKNSSQGELKKQGAAHSLSHDKISQRNSDSLPSTASSAADRLSHAMSMIKSLRVHIEAVDNGDIPKISKPPCSELELSQHVALVLKLCSSFSSHSWSVARSGCVGALAVVATFHLQEHRSMAPWISDTLNTISLIVNLLYDAQKMGARDSSGLLNRN